MIYRRPSGDFVALFDNNGVLAGDRVNDSEKAICRAGGIPCSWCAITGNFEAVPVLVRELADNAEESRADAALFQRLSNGVREVAKKYNIPV